MREGFPGTFRRRSSGWARTGALVLAALLALFLLTPAYFLYYPNALKPVAVYAVDSYLGRELIIDGDLTVELSRSPLITVNHFRFSNPPDSAERWMATADYTRVRIDLPGLFENRVRLLELTARGARLNLHDSVDGRPNWLFSETNEEVEDGADWSFMIERLSIVESVIDLRLGELEPILLTIPTLEETTDAEGHLTLDGEGLINGDPWALDGQVGPLDQILAAGRIELDLHLQIDQAALDAVGSIGDLATLSALDLGITARGPDAELLGRIFRMPDVFRGDVELNADIRPDPVGHRLSTRGHISEFHVETSGTVADLGNLDGWDASAVLRGPDAGVFGKALQIRGFPDGPFEVQGSMHLHGGDLDLKDVVIETDDALLRASADFVQFPQREGAVASLSLTGDDLSVFRELLQLPHLPASPFDLSAKLDATGTEMLNSTLNVGQNRLTVAGSVGEYPDFHGTDLKVTARGDDVLNVTRALGLALPFSGNYEAGSQLVLDADGLGLRQTRVQLPGQTIEGDLHWTDPFDPDSLEFRGTLTLSDLAETAALFDVSGLPALPVTSSGALRVRDGALTILESRTRMRSLELTALGTVGRPGMLSDMDLTIGLSGPSLEVLFDDALTTGEDIPFSVKAELTGADQALNVRAFQLQTSGGTFTADGRLALADGLVGSVFTLDGSGTNLGDLIPAFPGYQPPDAPWRLAAKLSLPATGHLEVTGGMLEIGSVNLKVDGLLDSDDLARTSLRIAASGERLGDVGNIRDIVWPDYPFDLTAEIHGTPSSLDVQALEASWGVSDLTGSGRILLGERPYFEILGRSKVLDIHDLQQALFGAPADEDPTDDARKVFPDTPIPLEDFADIDGLIDIHVDRFRGQRARLDDIELDLNAKDGVITLDRIALRDETGYFHGSAMLRPENGKAHLELQLKGEDADLGLFVDENQAPETIPRYTLDVDIWGSGRTVAELAGALNGKLLISSDGGQISNLLMQAFAGDFVTNVLDTLNPFVKGEEFTRMDCLVLNSVLNDGKLKLEPGFVMRTARVNMFVYGSANLATEKLDLSLATQARKGIGISAATITNPYFKVGGTLAEPALQLDPASAAVAASVATATAGLSILLRGFWDRLMGSQNPCPNFLKYEQTLPERTERVAVPATAPVEPG